MEGKTGVKKVKTRWPWRPRPHGSFSMSFEETERDTYKVLWGEREKIGQPNGLLLGATS